MKFDYSKTINEQLPTFEYYKDRYCSYELELINDRKEIKRLNNIINEFDKWLEVNLTNLEKEETSNIYNEGLKQGMLSNGRLIKSKLQELKGSDKE